MNHMNLEPVTRWEIKVHSSGCQARPGEGLQRRKDLSASKKCFYSNTQRKSVLQPHLLVRQKKPVWPPRLLPEQSQHNQDIPHLPLPAPPSLCSSGNTCKKNPFLADNIDLIYLFLNKQKCNSFILVGCITLDYLITLGCFHS